MRTRLVWMLACLFGAAVPVAAEELGYDNGEVRGALAGLVPGNAEAMRLTTAHPARVNSVRLSFTQPGPVEIHLWSDNGGQQADLVGDFGGELVEPVVAQVPSSGIVEVTFNPPIEVGPEIHFFVGHVIQVEQGPVLLVDTSESEICRAMVWSYSSAAGGDAWGGVGEEVDGAVICRHYLVRAEVEYHDVVEVRSFADVTEQVGFGRPRRVAAVDWDGDGWTDVFASGRLWRNFGGVFLDVSEAVGLPEVPGLSGGVFGDCDRDGDLDLFLFVNSCCTEEEAEGRRDVLLRNDEGVFVDVTEQAGLFDYRPNQSAAWGDYDGDGDLDLILPGYEKTGTLATGNTLFENLGDCTFRDATTRSGVGMVPAMISRTVTWADYDSDGLLDLYVGAYRLHRNYLFHNVGGFFEEVSDATGTVGIETIGAYGHSIGAEWGDLDNDEDLDLVVMNLAHPRFYSFSDFSKIYLNPLESGGGEFVDVREQIGVRVVETASEPALGDFDNDGDLDLFQTNVYVGRESNFYANRLIEEGALRFEEISYPTGARVDNGWGATWADFDNDGDLDLLAQGLYRNDGQNGHWLKVRLVGGPDQDAYGVGATVTVRAGSLVVTRLVSAGKGVGNQNPFELHFGLGPVATYDEIEVRWLGGQVDLYPCGQVDQRLVLVQGDLGDFLPGGCPVVEETTGGGCGCRSVPGRTGLGMLLVLVLLVGRRNMCRADLSVC